jgi:poly(hydroxyalkanoate) depolymerase family esterase
MIKNFRLLPDFHPRVAGRRARKGLLRAAIAGTMAFSGSAGAGLLCDFFGMGCPPTCGSLTQITDFGKNPGELLMCVYVPDGLPADRPLVVALHGCTQQAQDYGDGPGWTQLADKYRFALLLPQQTRANNLTKCFNWFKPDDVKRHDAAGMTGEAASIWEMIQKMQFNDKTDPKQVYVTGLSAGGAMTAALLTAYPEVFQGGAIVAGIPYGCAKGMMDGFSCMNTGKDLSPQQWGDQVRAAAPGHIAGDGAPKVAIWQGLTDSMVEPTNAGELVDEWTNVVGIDQTPDQIATVNGAKYKGYADGSGTVLVEEYLIPGMDHGVAIDPTHGCGKAAPYILDKGICSSQLIVTFWGLSP